MQKVIQEEYQRFDETYNIEQRQDYKQTGDDFWNAQAEVKDRLEDNSEFALDDLNEVQTKLEALNRQAGFETGFKAGLVYQLSKDGGVDA